MGTQSVGVMVELSAPGATMLKVVVSQPLVVGREGDGLRISDAKVSRRHIEVRPDGDHAVMVTGLGSTNGTYLNGTRMTGQGRVGRNDSLRLGRTVLRCLGSVTVVEPVGADGGQIHASDLVDELTRSLPDMPFGSATIVELKGLGQVVIRPVLWSDFGG